MKNEKLDEPNVEEVKAAAAAILLLLMVNGVPNTKSVAVALRVASRFSGPDGLNVEGGTAAEFKELMRREVEFAIADMRN